MEEMAPMGEMARVKRLLRELLPWKGRRTILLAVCSEEAGGVGLRVGVLWLTT